MRWTPYVDRRNGRTVKSGISPQERQARVTADGFYRGIVLKTYATDDANRIDEHPYAIECDVLLMRSLVVLPHVPVLQRGLGVTDADLWIPRPSTRSLSGGPLTLSMRSSRGALQEFPTKLGDLDGDNVLVTYIEHDQEHPVIIGPMPHTGTKRLVVKGAGWSPSALGSERGTPHLSEHYFRYRGVEVRINDKGDVLLDTVGAYDKTGEIADSPMPSGGQVRLRVKGTEKFVIEMNGQDLLEFTAAGAIALLKLAGALQADMEVSAMNLSPATAVHLSTHLTPSPFGPLGPPIPGS